MYSKSTVQVYSNSADPTFRTFCLELDPSSPPIPHWLTSTYTVQHKVRTYKEYHSVCPSAELGLSQPLSRQRVFPSPQKQGGGDTLARGWGVGGESQFRRGAYTVVLFICTYFVLCSYGCFAKPGLEEISLKISESEFVASSLQNCALARVNLIHLLNI
jgi:hypothetical protein